MESRIKNIRRKLLQENLDGLISSSAANISYLTKAGGRDAYLLICAKENIYFTDSRYTEEAKIALGNRAKLKKINGSLFKNIAEAALGLGLKRIGFEERLLPFAEHKKIEGHLKKKARLIPTHSLIEELRQIKDREELALIRKAVGITAGTLKFIRKFIRCGRKEVELAAEMERFIRYKGAIDSAFDLIAAGGPNSSFPHHIPGQRRLKNHEPVLIDIGVDYHGYKSDLTRVYFLGKIKGLVRQVYSIVSEAKALAIKKIAPGVPIGEIDRAGREYIRKKGYGEFFGHNLGHGVGLEVHELPHIRPQEEAVLEPGMCFTIEPAIYLPGKFGIRLEDIVAVTKKGCEVLSGLID